MSESIWPVEVPDFNFEGKTVVVTGSTKGIGRAIAFAYARCGANVVVSGRSQEDCDNTAKEIKDLCAVTPERVTADAAHEDKSPLNEISGSAAGIRADVRSLDDIKALAWQTSECFGSPDIWVNCAGMAITKKILDVTSEDYDLVMETNLRSVYFASQTAAKYMRDAGGGVIIQIASVGGLQGSNGLSLYGASKAAVINLTKTMALEWSRYGIRVNAICPGYVETELNREALADEKIREQIVRGNPQRRLGTVDEVAAVALFLGSEQSGMINGEAVVADMGSICG